jgi:uncharacterized protein YukE
MTEDRIKEIRGKTKNIANLYNRDEIVYLLSTISRLEGEMRESKESWEKTQGFMQKTIDDFYKDAERLSLLLKDLSATSHNLFTTIDALKEGGGSWDRVWEKVSNLKQAIQNIDDEELVKQRKEDSEWLLHSWNIITIAVVRAARDSGITIPKNKNDDAEDWNPETIVSLCKQLTSALQEREKEVEKLTHRLELATNMYLSHKDKSMVELKREIADLQKKLAWEGARFKPIDEVYKKWNNQGLDLEGYAADMWQAIKQAGEK